MAQVRNQRKEGKASPGRAGGVDPAGCPALFDRTPVFGLYDPVSYPESQTGTKTGI